MTILLYCECDGCRHNHVYECMLNTPGIGSDGACLYMEPLSDDDGYLPEIP